MTITKSIPLTAKIVSKVDLTSDLLVFCFIGLGSPSDVEQLSVTPTYMGKMDQKFSSTYVRYNADIQKKELMGYGAEFETMN